MNKYIKRMAIVIISPFMLFSSIQCVDSEAITKEIKKWSDITKDDVSKAKFIYGINNYLAPTATVLLPLVGAFGGYQAGKAINSYVPLLAENVQLLTKPLVLAAVTGIFAGYSGLVNYDEKAQTVPLMGKSLPYALTGAAAYASYKIGELIHPYAPLVAENLQAITNPYFLMLAAGAFVRYKTYQFMYSYTKEAMRKKVKKYISLCEKLPIANITASAVPEFQKLFGESQIYEFSLYQNPDEMRLITKNLYAQAVYAEELIGKLELESDDLEKRVITQYKNTLQANLSKLGSESESKDKKKKD